MELRKTPTAKEEVAEPGDSVAELDAALERIKSLLEESDVEGARALSAELQRRWPDDTTVRYWARVLAPPEVRVAKGERGRPLDREIAWLREHAREYPGCWLAVFGDRLIAADPDLGIVLGVVRQTPGAETAALFFEPPRSK